MYKKKKKKKKKKKRHKQMSGPELCQKGDRISIPAMINEHRDLTSWRRASASDERRGEGETAAPRMCFLVTETLSAAAYDIRRPRNARKEKEKHAGTALFVSPLSTEELNTLYERLEVCVCVWFYVLARARMCVCGREERQWQNTRPFTFVLHI